MIKVIFSHKAQAFSKVVVAVETPAYNPRFAATRLVARVSSEEIQVLVQERLATGVVIRTDGWQGYSFLDAFPGRRHEWLVPGSGKNSPKVLPWVHSLTANVKVNVQGIHHGVSPKHLPRYLAEFCYRFNRRFWEPANVQPHVSCLSQFHNRHLPRAKGIIDNGFFNRNFNHLTKQLPSGKGKQALPPQKDQNIQ